jgi:thiosulfate reductase cytochrome b subunit
MAHQREILNPLPVRLWHAIHAAAIIMLILTGIHLRFPDVFALFGTLKKAIDLHNLIGAIAIGDYFLWFVYYVVRKDLMKQYLPTLKDLRQGTGHQAAYYFFRIFLGDPPPFEPKADAKFNALQKTSYCGIMFLLLPLQAVTGILLWDIETFLPLTAAVGGIRLIDTLHVLLAYVFTAFLVIHVYLATLGHTVFSHFRAIVLGYEE